jgi:hypothetical protein
MAEDDIVAEGVVVDSDTAEVAAEPRANIARIIAALLLGLLIGAVGTAIHRTTLATGLGFEQLPFPPTYWGATFAEYLMFLPLGLLFALLLTASAALLMRSWVRLPSLAAFAVGWVVAVELLSLVGPGGDVLVLDPSANVPVRHAGVLWTYLGIGVIVLTMLLPRRWFSGPTKAERTG